MRYEEKQEALWKILKALSLQQYENEDDFLLVHKWMEAENLRYALFPLPETELEKHIAFLGNSDLQKRATILPFEECVPSFGHEFFIPDDSKRHQNSLRKQLSLKEGSHYVLIDMAKQRVVCESVGRYLVYDMNCVGFPWEGGVRKLLQSDFVNVAELSDMQYLEHIPRTCFLFGNEAKITNLTIPVVDHMRQIMAMVT